VLKRKKGQADGESIRRSDSYDNGKTFLVEAVSLADRIRRVGGIGPEVVRKVSMRRAFASAARR